jgi:thiamine-phosphate diphosphorylase
VLVSERQLDDAAQLDMTRELIESSDRIAVHLRARVPAKLLFAAACDLSARAWVTGAWCVVNGRPDIALAASAQAVQLGRTALPIAAVRRVLSGDSGVRIGVSVHSPREAEVSAAEGANYLVAGTAFATPSHPGVDGIGALGIEEVVRAVDGLGVPVFAIGGVNRGRLGELVLAGVAGVVVGRAVWGSHDPVAATRAMVDEFESALAR